MIEEKTVTGQSDILFLPFLVQRIATSFQQEALPGDTMVISQATAPVVLFTLKSKLLGLLTQYEKTLRLKPKPKHCKLATGKEGRKAATIFEKLKQS